MRSPGFFVPLLVTFVASGCVGGSSDDHIDTEAIARAAPQPKIKICHIPPGNPGNAHTISVAESAAAAHFAHGDSDGPCVCPAGEEWTCYSAPLETDGIGACQRGVKTCNPDAQGYGPCVGEIVPVTEVCDDDIDNDCDGATDESCVCAVGSTRACYTGPAGTDDVGVCRAGEQVCADGSGYGACTGEVRPSPEVCGDGLDDDCDGIIDEGCVCAPGSAAACYDGPAGTAGVGVCAAGTRTCDADGNGYGACIGPITPTAEVCGDGLDNDCDGVADDGCVCAPGTSASCYSGPAGTDGVGVCTAGARFCNADGTAYDACVGSIEPSADVCGDGIDNDCDGMADEACVCAPGSASACYEGPPGTDGIGICRSGVKACNADGTDYGACLGSITPLPEICGDGLDNDCDGYADDGCVCVPDSTTACYDGPAGAAGVGACVLGSQTCNSIGTGFGACLGSVAPVAEVCGDSIDNDCDGHTDEGCIGDRVWRDTIRGTSTTTGIQNTGEVGVAGVTIQLRTASGALVAIQVTDVNGAYWFSNVPSGTYYLTLSAPLGYALVGANAGTDDSVDSDFDDEDQVTPNFSFSATSPITNIDAGLVGGGPL